MDPAHKTLTVPNGTLKMQQHQQQGAVYRECLKNHAASLGGHSLDGCGEFMASPSSDPSDPTSLTCAACGCHRNFHRRLPFLRHPSPPPPPPPPQPLLLQHHPDDDDNADGEDQEEDDASEDDNADGETGDNNHSNINHINNSNNSISVPHMLMALSKAAAAGTTAQGQGQGQGQGQQRSRKRFRTRFSPEQKERMQELSERLGWRMQKRDEGLVEDRCREIGVGKGVFKVWMHNNKHNFVPRSLDASSLPPVISSSSPAAPLAIPTVSAMSTLPPAAAGAGIINGGNSRAIDS